jgi:hypothetical protein
VLLGAEDVDDPPTERAEALVRAADAGLDDDDLEPLELLNQHLLAHAEEEQLYTRVVPRLPGQLLTAYVEHLPGASSEP